MNETRSTRLSFVATTLILAIVGAILIAIPFLGSLPPNKVALEKYRKEIDISALAPGELLRARWFSNVVFVLRRTPEQIQFLKSRHSPTLYEQLANEERRSGLLNNL